MWCLITTLFAWLCVVFDNNAVRMVVCGGWHFTHMWKTFPWPHHFTRGGRVSARGGGVSARGGGVSARDGGVSARGGGVSAHTIGLTQPWVRGVDVASFHDCSYYLSCFFLSSYVVFQISVVDSRWPIMCFVSRHLFLQRVNWFEYQPLFMV